MRYTVGQWVWVGRTVEAGYFGKLRWGSPTRKVASRRELLVHDAGWPAVVVGATRVKLGTRHCGGPHESPSFTVGRTVLAYLVRRGVTNKAHRALSQHLRPIAPQELPWFYNSDPGGHRGFAEWELGVKAKAVETVLGGVCRYCGDAGYLQPHQHPPNAPATPRKPCPACNPRGARL